jgi:hypothetical protein
VGFSVGAEGEFGHRDVATTRGGISAGPGFGQPETGDLGLAERHARHHRVVVDVTALHPERPGNAESAITVRGAATRARILGRARIIVRLGVDTTTVDGIRQVSETSKS